MTSARARTQIEPLDAELNAPTYYYYYFFFSLVSFVVNITCISLQRLEAKKQGRGIGGNAPELGLIFQLSRYELLEITWNRTDGKYQDSRLRKCTKCDSFNS